MQRYIVTYKKGDEVNQKEIERLTEVKKYITEKDANLTEQELQEVNALYEELNDSTSKGNNPVNGEYNFNKYFGLDFEVPKSEDVNRAIEAIKSLIFSGNVDALYQKLLRATSKEEILNDILLGRKEEMSTRLKKLTFNGLENLPEDFIVSLTAKYLITEYWRNKVDKMEKEGSKNQLEHDTVASDNLSETMRLLSFPKEAYENGTAVLSAKIFADYLLIQQQETTLCGSCKNVGRCQRTSDMFSKRFISSRYRIPDFVTEAIICVGKGSATNNNTTNNRYSVKACEHYQSTEEKKLTTEESLRRKQQQRKLADDIWELYTDGGTIIPSDPKLNDEDRDFIPRTYRKK